jgi:hypothetical protein
MRILELNKLLHDMTSIVYFLIYTKCRSFAFRKTAQYKHSNAITMQLHPTFIHQGNKLTTATNATDTATHTCALSVPAAP